MLMELEIGILRIERRDNGQGEWLRTWTDQNMVPEFRGRAPLMDSASIQRCAQLHLPDLRAERDGCVQRHRT